MVWCGPFGVAIDTCGALVTDDVGNTTWRAARAKT
jgi:hypothetical protein